MAAIDISPVADSVLANITAVSLVGLACLGVWGAISAFKVLRLMLGGGGGASVAPASSGGGIEAVYARAAAMAAAGEGQSEDYGHNVRTEAFDAGYAGRRLGDVVDPAAMQAFRDGQAARAEDRK